MQDASLTADQKLSLRLSVAKDNEERRRLEAEMAKDPNSPKVIANLAAVLQATGKVDEAITLYEKAYALGLDGMKATDPRSPRRRNGWPAASGTRPDGPSQRPAGRGSKTKLTSKIRAKKKKTKKKKKKKKTKRTYCYGDHCDPE